MIYLAATLVLLSTAAGWLLTLFSLPGNWVIVGAAALYAWYVPADSSWDVSWTIVIALLVLATLGELIELLAGAMGARGRGGSRRGAVLAIAGSLVGALVGATIGIPIPLVGSVIGVMLGASRGARGGAMLGESWKGRTLGQSWSSGQAAFWGRLFGSLAKTMIASAMAVITVFAVPF